MSIATKRPLIGVGVVVFKDDRIVLIRRAKSPRQGSWSLPGGRQRLGETVRETAAREVREECSLEIEVTTLLDVIDSLTHEPAGILQYHYTLIDFMAEWRSGTARAGGDAAEVIWADPESLADLDLWSETERVIGLAVARRGG